jgi:hypothetical protein
VYSCAQLHFSFLIIEETKQCLVISLLEIKIDKCLAGILPLEPLHQPVHTFLFYFIFLVLGFELMTSRLLGRHSTT